VLEVRLRVFDVGEHVTDPPSLLGIIEGFPGILVQATTVEQTERYLVNAFEEHLQRRMDHEATRLPLDDFPTVSALRLLSARVPGEMVVARVDCP